MKSRKIKVSFYVTIKTDATDEQIQDWIEYELEGGMMKSSHPLSNQSLEPDPFTIDFDFCCGD